MLLPSSGFEGTDYMGNFRGRPGYRNCDNIKSYGSVHEILASQVIECCQTDLVLFSFGNRLCRMTKSRRFPGFHLNKDNTISIIGNNIYFTGFPPVVSDYDLISFMGQIVNGDIFTPFTETDSLFRQTPLLLYS